MIPQSAADPWLLAPLFAAVAFLYSSVGLAGGSSYIALLTVSGMDWLLIPTIALSMNLVVSAVGAWNFFRGDHARPRLIVPLLVSSLPAAWIGGGVRLPSRAFHLLLFVFLAIVAARIYLFPAVSPLFSPGRRAGIAVSLVSGAVLGFVSGALGLGGGIYLVPLVVLFGLGSQKEAAACGAFFIWVNSAAGLAARLGAHPLPRMELMAPLVVAVAAGGYAGSFLGATRLSPRTMQRLLGAVVLAALAFIAPRCF